MNGQYLVIGLLALFIVVAFLASCSQSTEWSLEVRKSS